MSGGDNTREHEALKRAVMLAASELDRAENPICCDFCGCSQFTGRDESGAMRHGGLTPGAFDLIGTVNGVRCDLEIKTGRGKLSTPQINWQARVRRAGGIAEEVRTVDDALAAIHAAYEKSSDKGNS